MAGAMSIEDVKKAVNSLEISPSKSSSQSPIQHGGSKSGAGSGPESGFHANVPGFEKNQKSGLKKKKKG